MAKLKIVIFDCDGVMFDSKEANRQYYNHLLDHFSHPQMSVEEEEYVHAHNVIDSVKFIFRHYHPDEIEKAHKYRVSNDYTPFLDYMLIEPDLKEFLELIKADHYTAISTNRTTTMPAVMKKFGLEKYFDKVVTALDVQRPKPHPDALQEILDQFKLSVDEAVYIGDSMVDREHADSVGMRLIAFKNPALPAEYHVSSFMEITSLPFFQD